jgi:hypothetical protein
VLGGAGPGLLQIPSSVLWAGIRWAPLGRLQQAGGASAGGRAARAAAAGPAGGVPKWVEPSRVENKPPPPPAALSAWWTWPRRSRCASARPCSCRPRWATCPSRWWRSWSACRRASCRRAAASRARGGHRAGGLRGFCSARGPRWLARAPGGAPCQAATAAATRRFAPRVALTPERARVAPRHRLAFPHLAPRRPSSLFLPGAAGRRPRGAQRAAVRPLPAAALPADTPDRGGRVLPGGPGVGRGSDFRVRGRPCRECAGPVHLVPNRAPASTPALWWQRIGMLLGPAAATATPQIHANHKQVPPRNAAL